MSTGLILVAGGSGKRFNTKNENDKKKQYFELNNKPIFIHTLEKFVDIDRIEEIVIVCPSEDIEYVQNETHKYISSQKSMKFVSGGNERVYSVINGFQNLSGNVDLIIVHDAVRPFIEKSLISHCISEADSYGSAIIAVPVTDTIKLTNSEHLIERTIDRSHLFRAQTPQVFKREVFVKGLENWYKVGEPKITDDAMFAELINHPVKIVTGSYSNIKITTKEDILIAESLLNSQNEPE